jgi:DNA-binding transcriptional LysR family regulator
MIDPRRLLTFRAVARERSFSRAAAALSLTQPAVSQHVSALERQLGVRLIDRGRGLFALTPAGALLLAHADALAERLDRADVQLRELVEGERRELRLGAFPSSLATLVPGVLIRLRAEDPELAVHAVQGSAAELAASVRDGGLHVALCFQDAAAPRREHDGLTRHDLFDEDFMALVPADHPSAGEASLALTRLREETWSAPSRDGIIVRSCRAAGFEPRVAFVTTDPLAIAELVAARLCVSLTFAALATRLGPRVAGVPLAGPPIRRAVYALTPPEGAHPVVERLLAGLRSPPTRGSAARRPRRLAGPPPPRRRST